MDFLLLTKDGGAIIGPIANLMGYVMEWIFNFTNLFGVFNIGVSIIIFTIIIKGAMVPMTIKQQKFSKMNVLMQPELQAIQKKYKNKKDQQSVLKQNEETMAVYEKYGVKPTGGCLQLIIQFPILLALYRVVYSIPAYVRSIKDVYKHIIEELMTKVTDFASNESFVNLLKQNNLKDSDITTITEYMSDTTAHADKLETVTNKLIDAMYNFDKHEWDTFNELFSSISGNIQQYIDEIDSMNSFLGLNLAISPMTYLTNFKEYGVGVLIVAVLIPLLSGGIQWISTKITSANQPQQQKKPEEENVMVQSMNMMITIMPIMSIAFCFMFPTCLGVYWIISSLVQLIIQICVNHYIEKLDLNDMVAKNIEKMNKKRAKQGLPPQKISKVANVSLKNLEVDQEAEEAAAKKREEQIRKSTEYYNQGAAKPGSLAAKAGMVQRYNEKNKK